MEAIALAMKNWLNRSLPEKSTERRRIFQRLRQLRLIEYRSDEELEQSEAWLRIHPMIVDFVSVDAVDAAGGMADARKSDGIGGGPSEAEQSAVGSLILGGSDHVS
jgi:hypothetical protein